MSQFAVVICAHDSRRWAHLQAAVGSVRRQTLPPYRHDVLEALNGFRLG